MTDGDARTHSQTPGVPRLTPYEMVFGEAGFEASVFPALLDEAESLGEDPGRRERFSFLSVAGDALREVVPPDAPLEMLEQYRALFYHAFNFWRFGRRAYLLDAPVARYLVEAPPSLEDWDLTLPHPSVYVQLPTNLFWASISTDAPPEPVDGFFAISVREDDPLGPVYRHLHVLMVLGMRRERAGFSVVPFDTEVGPGIAAVWEETPGREEERDFTTVLPGGEMAGIYSVLTTAEVLKLLARVLWYADRHPEEVTAEPAAERRIEERTASIPRSRLPFQRIRLDPDGGRTDA